MQRYRSRLPFCCPSPGLLGLILLILVGCSTVVWGSDEPSSDIREKCHEECSSSLITQRNNDLNIRCNDSCKVDKCQEGCDLWTEALYSNCQDLCNGSTHVIPDDKALFCMMGCHFALNVYVKLIKDQVGIPAAPVLVAQSQTNVSVTLRWKGSPNRNLTYLVQWKYESQQGDWEYYEPSSPLRITECKVNKLYPYTKYKFRIAWIILPQHDPLMSAESLIISTLPYGGKVNIDTLNRVTKEDVPSSAPTINLFAVDPTRIEVSWDPPLRCNGPILSYAVSLKDTSNGHVLVKDISNEKAECFYLFNNLKPNTLYNISVLARNNIGEGPSGSGSCRTPARVQVQQTYEDPYLILGAKNQIIKQGCGYTDEQTVIYQSENTSVLIRDVSLHIARQLVFFSDSSGFVYSVSLEGDKVPKRILKPSSYLHYPGILSVDWLNDKLYIVDENRIGRCDLDGSNYETVVVSIPSKPTSMKVDPYNGFLFWISRNNNKGNVYKVDLIEVGSKPLTMENAKLIFSDDNLTVFATDHSSLQLILPYQSKNTVVSISFDGLEITDVRRNTQQPKFHNVKSFVVHDGLFFWTTGKEIIKEEYLEAEDKYYHNSFPQSSSQNPYVGLNILHPDSQPYPVPLNPVSHLEAVFDTNQCKISWTPPKLLRGIGHGAWQKWNYELLISDSNNQEILHVTNISTTPFLANNLQNNITYIIKARAYSLGGKGPWSEEYKGRTLRKGGMERYPFMLWSSREGILKSNMLATVVEPFIHRRALHRSHIIDFSWYDDLLFLNTNSTHIFVYNMTSRHPPKRLHNINNAHSLAVDWFARKLYWSNPYQQVISRSYFDGSQQEPLPIPTVARELNVDSASAFLYWTTMYSVECARLNGGDRQVYFQAGFFAGKQVLGLTVDTDNHKVYWMVRSQEGAQLYRGTMAGFTDVSLKDTVKEIRILQEDIIRGPLRYYSDRLFWLHDQREALITDINGLNIASLKGPDLSNLKTLTVIDPQLHQYPAGLTKHTLNVRPHQVSNNITVQGSWDNFTVMWQQVTNVNYGKVFYETKVDCDYFKYTMITEDNYIAFARFQPLPPYTNITIALRAFTYWSSSRRVIEVIQSPMSVPSEPVHLRIFISHEKPTLTTNQKNIIAQVRWSPPEHPNGIIKGYHVACWMMNETPTPPDCNRTIYNPQKLEHTILGLFPDSTYYFQVTAFTNVGDGPKSHIVEAKTSEESPVPRLLLTKLDAIQVADMDSREEQLVSMDSMEPIDVTYLNQDRYVFWIDRLQGLMRSNLDGSDKMQMLSLTSRGSSITVDWIGRFLYWSEIDEASQISTIWKFDLNYQSNSKKLIQRKGIIRTLRVNPFSSMLLWTLEDENKTGFLMSSDTNGKLIHVLFRRHQYSMKQKREAFKENDKCSCPKEVNVGKPLTVDVSNPQQQKIFWVDQMTGDIWESDTLGCKCHIIVNSTLFDNNGLPPTSLTVDKTRIYWSNASLQSIFSIEKPPDFDKEESPFNEKLINSEIVNGVNIINAIGSGLQPMPDKDCLVPSQYEEPPTLHRSFPDSLIIRMSPVHPRVECGEISQPSVYYVIFYRLYNDSSVEDCRVNSTICQIVKSYEPLVNISNLLPYRHYAIQVTVGNNYTSHYNFLTPEVVFMTEAGAPSEPTNVSLEVLNPEAILVSWSPPTHLNGPYVHYYLHWEMVHKVSGFLLQIVHPSKDLPSEDRYHTVLEHLLPNSTYYIAVRAYSSTNKSLYGESPKKFITTFPTPGNLTAEKVTSSSLVLKWHLIGDNNVIEDSLMCREGYSNKHSVLSQQTIHNDTVHFYMLNRLHPKTKYVCHFFVTYCVHLANCNFTWPKGDHFTFETLGDKPGEPGVPFVTFLKKDTFQVTWDSSPDNGGKILYYILQAQAYHGDIKENIEWHTVYNGSQPKWLVSGLNLNYEYYFRVMAINEYGFSNFSHVSTPFNFSDTAMNEEETSIILAISISVITILIMITMCVLYRVCKQREKDKLILQDVVRATGNADVELATLQDLPHSGNFRHQTNILYSIGNHLIDEELAALPHISRDQIILTKFLGSGAFGEVFEGFARDLQEGLDGDMKVAIKTLRKGATDQEKAEFLKEAQLMSNFKHEHILSLLGVCLDNDPNFIILELMEGGDLLSYLRSNRPTALESSPLTVPDLISICVDVAKGCKYLEEMHFVHRDLAARNCLVSSRNPALRVVKIGDFGLARDIYKNDYYRKEGEGLLPVRWMSPESLMDGVFTTQSDAWAFGVLLWEVMTLGQQPYPARNNLEVLHYVRAGGRLDKPDNCPDDLHQLMLLCWSYNPDHRPTFTYCLDQLQELKRKSADLPNCIHNNHYVGRTLTDGIYNQGYSEEDIIAIQGVSPPNSLVKERGTVTSSNDVTNNNDSLHCHRTTSMQDLLTKRGLTVDIKPQNGIMPMERPINSSQDIPKYLELLCDDVSFSSLASDGYEIPISGCTLDKKIDIASQSSNTSSARANGTPCLSNSVISSSSQRPVTDENKCQALNGKLSSTRPCSCPPQSEDDVGSSSNPFVLAPRYANFGSCEKCLDDSSSHRSSFCSTTPSTVNQSELLENHVPTVSWC